MERLGLEGVIVDPGADVPFATPTDAQAVMDEAFMLMRDGSERVEQGQLLLALAERRQAWKILGFDSWEDCMIHGIGTHLRTTIDPELRSALTVQLRARETLSTRAIARVFRVAHSTTVRDLRLARERGQLDGEPKKITSRDGRMRNSTMAPNTPRRKDLLKTWRGAVDDITRRTGTLATLTKDDRFRPRIGDLSTATRADLQRAHAILTTILHEFGPATPKEN